MMLGNFNVVGRRIHFYIIRAMQSSDVCYVMCFFFQSSPCAVYGKSRVIKTLMNHLFKARNDNTGQIGSTAGRVPIAQYIQMYAHVLYTRYCAFFSLIYHPHLPIYFKIIASLPLGQWCYISPYINGINFTWTPTKKRNIRYNTTALQ